MRNTSPAVTTTDSASGDKPAAPPCKSCGGSGLVCPDPFCEWEPWEGYRARMAAEREEKGWPESSSAILAGLLRPLACPDCTRG